ncbi:MAG: hypothetical protein GY842_12305 [bacterium]|nr:hypothetical protein [bacterium]
MMASLAPCPTPPSSEVDTWAAWSRDDLLHQRVLTLHRRHAFKCALETGTWKGHTTVALAQVFPTVYTIEIDDERFEANQARLASYPNVTALHGPSPQVMLKLIDHLEYPLFVFLDAHWEADWPLRDELKILLSVRRPKLILIHDFKVPGRDFGYDRYGEQECSLEYIGDLLPHDECRYTFNSHAAPHSERRGALFIEHLMEPDAVSP